MFKISSESIEACVADISRILEMSGFSKTKPKLKRSEQELLSYQYSSRASSKTPDIFLRKILLFSDKDGITLRYEIAERENFNMSKEPNPYMLLSDSFFVSKNFLPSYLTQKVEEVFEISNLKELYYANPKVRGESVAKKTGILEFREFLASRNLLS
jgi:hypothetical protein